MAHMSAELQQSLIFWSDNVLFQLITESLMGNTLTYSFPCALSLYTLFCFTYYSKCEDNFRAILGKYALFQQETK